MKNKKREKKVEDVSLEVEQSCGRKCRRITEMNVKRVMEKVIELRLYENINRSMEIIRKKIVFGQRIWQDSYKIAWKKIKIIREIKWKKIY